jgi:insertion element IS1 protein InsB
VAFHRIKKNKKWIFKAVDRKSRKTVAWVTGNRDVATFKKLYKQIKHLKKCKFYTDKWIGFSKVLPKRRHFAGKKHTFTIEQNNSNTRHYLARMVRKSKVISRSEFMLNASLKLLFALSFDSSPLQLLLQSLDIFI